jgi:hypothetical protein
MRASDSAFLVFVALCAACVGSGNARYPEREPGCAVQQIAGEPKMAVDDLGMVNVDCLGDGSRCRRQLLDEVCKRGGDVAYGLGLNALNATKLVAHAAHSRRATQGPRERGCAVQVVDDVASMKTENIGPVTALCDQDDSREVCLRELQDQVCLLGGDLLWQVDGPSREGDKQRMHGRAAHTK